ncbi:sigma-70 family RNA polymerase sigma factor [Streptomonospora nanhaiensis]|uniref:sigma-70 family RNA polymerase sigma factor n=1 Tax=Streptomonospora nanhaiensis TaxID=1323731 RepID=UPI001C3804C3|nr:sigma-70 family RNA polymerase sigma factor [Streptomonospora nanhaiensis]MBV2366238.1 sigma-70 family RNA polymerase sigma factor [Streptomonospora nanhaiensis]
MYSDTALDVAEREFLRLVPDPLRLERGDAAPAFNLAALPGVVWPLDLLASRTLLLAPGTDRAVKDSVWQVVIARARMSQDWMCGAIGLAMPALKGCARRCTRGLTPAGVEEVDAEILAGFIAAVREIRTDYANLAWYLRCRAQRAGLRSRRRLLEQAGAEVGDHDAPAANRVASGGGHPDLVLERAVSRGVLSLAEADLIGATRLEETSLREVAAASGEGYWALAKRRSRAEERLLAALESGDLDPVAGSAAHAEPDLGRAPRASSALRVSSVSKPGWALAL